MIKPEINEIKKLLSIKKCPINRIAACYVDGDKEKKSIINQAFFSLPEEEMFKYFEIFKKVLSGTIGKNLVTLDFPLKEEEPGGTQEFLFRLKNSELKDDALLMEYFDKIISTYEYVGNYLILLTSSTYDVPGKTSDGIEMEDASDEVYSFLLAAICPVNLSKPGLSYNAVENIFQNRIRDWVVEMPETGYLFPAFHDRSSDIHSTLFYKKDAEDIKDEYITSLFGCPMPLSAGTQKETFRSIVEETLGETCTLETVKNIHEELNKLVEEHKEEPAPLVLDRSEVKNVLAKSGVENEKMAHFEERYEQAAGEDTPLYVSNVFNTRSFEVKTPDVVIKVKPDKTNLIETKIIDGRECVVIALEGDVEVNGITLQHSETEPEA